MHSKALQICFVVIQSVSCETVECFWDELILFQSSLWWFDHFIFQKSPSERPQDEDKVSTCSSLKERNKHFTSSIEHIQVLYIFVFLFTFMTDF